MEGVDANTEMEGILASDFRHILVRTDTCGFEGFRRKLLVLIGDEMAAEGELVDRCALAAQIEDTDLQKISAKHFTSTYLFHTFESGTPRLYRDFGYGLFLQ